MMNSKTNQNFQDDEGHKNRALAQAFMRWQCRVRQIMMRQNSGKPDDSIVPSLSINDQKEPLGHIITILSKTSEYSMIPEFQFLCKKTHDPAKRREKALELLCERYFQHPETFSDILTSTFSPESKNIEVILAAKTCRLDFFAYEQRFSINCLVRKLKPEEELYQATYWHNVLFNPNLKPEMKMLAFKPIWSSSFSDPKF